MLAAICCAVQNALLPKFATFASYQFTLVMRLYPALRIAHT